MVHGDVNDFKISHLFNQMTNLTTGFASQLPVIENPATFPSPVPRGYSVATDSGFSGHYVGVDTSSESRLMYFTYDGSFHQQTAGGLLNTLSDGSLMCATSSFPAIGFDRSTSAHGLHIVYYCVPGGAAANEIVHLFYDGSAWKRSLVTQVTMAVPSSTPGNSRLGFAVHDGRAIVVYWNANGDMTYQIGTFNAGIYSWGVPVGFDTQSAGVTYHTPQAAMGSGSLVRVAYVVYDTTGVTPESRIRLVYETQINSWDVSILKSFQHATNRLFLGLGLGITGMAGNSAR